MYYSVSNGGDGSAYPEFFVTRRAAEMHQELENCEDDGWAEDCFGEVKDAKTDEEWLKELKECVDDYSKSSKRYKLITKFIKELEKKLKK